jgi:hypothetical protein
VSGKSGDGETVTKEGIAQIIYAHLERLPKPKDGEPGAPGKDGKDVDLVALSSAVADEVAKIPSPTDGKDGSDGKDGANGKDGKDVDPAALDEIRASVSDVLRQAEAAVDSGLVELASAVAAVKALPIAPASFFIDDKGELVAVYPDGATKSVGMVRGKDGTRGASIMDGKVESSGELVLRISDGRVVNAGIVRGESGKAGESKAGASGRDAVEIKPLPAVDETKVYAEGTYAFYRGGTVRAERTTDPIEDADILKSGWRVAWNGIFEETETEIDGGRFIERTTTYTDGKTWTRKTTTAAMVYRGIWTDKEFQRGDTATWDGSLWHCEAPTRGKPGLSPDWKLVAKRGRDGKDATKH